MPLFKSTFLKIFFIPFLFYFSSCNRKEIQKESSFKTADLYINEQEQIETYFFIEAANASNSIISKSQIAQQKRSESSIKELSAKIENYQNELLQKISELANKRLIIITDISTTHKREVYKLLDTNDANFDKMYLNSMAESLTEQIGLFEKISTETNDKTILKLVLQYLPGQYQLLRDIEKTKTEFN